MMAAAQPFISGAISKTINMPYEATIDDVKQAYWLSLAADDEGERALPRRLQAEPAAELRRRLARGRDPRRDHGGAGVRAPARSRSAWPRRSRRRIIHRYLARRRRLPDRRAGYTQKARIGNHKIYLRTGEYDDGTLGEIFIDMHKEGAAFRSMTNCFAIAVTLGLQHGVPLEEYVDAFLFTRFEPNGMVQGNPHIKMTTSIIDYIFRELAITYLGRHDLAHVIPEDLRADAMHDEDGGDGTPYNGEQVISERVVDADEYNRGVNRLPAPRTSHVKPLKTGNGKSVSPPKPALTLQTARVKAPAAMATTPAPAKVAVRGSKEDAVRVARQKGYEGDPCGECGALTLVRNGACLKCDTCGSTSGCS